MAFYLQQCRVAIKDNIYEYGSLFKIKHEHCKCSCRIKIPYIKFHHKWNSILSGQMDGTGSGSCLMMISILNCGVVLPKNWFPSSTIFQPHGPVTLRSRGRGASSRTSQEEGESKHSAAIEHQQQQQQQSSCQQQDDDELPLARVRDDALARKVHVSFAYCYLVKILIHFEHQLYKVCHITSTERYNLKSNCWWNEPEEKYVVLLDFTMEVL